MIFFRTPLIEYSLHHGPWIIYKTVPNTVFSMDDTPSLSSTFPRRHTYNWRVVAIALPSAGPNAPSPSMAAFFTMGTSESGVFPVKIQLDNSYSNTSAMLFNLSNVMAATGLSYSVQQNIASTWTPVASLTSVPIPTGATSFTIPTGSGLTSGGEYIIKVSNGSTNSNSIRFYYAPVPL